MLCARDQCDVLILGGGPAGSAAAIDFARRGVAVALLERSSYEGSRLGETLPPETARLLQSLGVWESFQHDGHRPSPGIVSAWGSEEPYENDFIFSPFGNGWHLDRARFDAMLAGAAEAAGAAVYRGARVLDCPRSADGTWRVSAEQDGQPLSFRARYVIDATGRAAWLAHRQGARRTVLDHLVGVAGHLDEVACTDSRLFLEAMPDGWWYSARLPNARAVAVYMTDADFLPRDRRKLREFWASTLRQAPLTSSFLGEGHEFVSLQTVAANSAVQRDVSGDGWVAVGDAAASYDPLSSRGISKALESGMMAARAAMRSLNGDPEGLAEYAAWVEADFAEYRRHHTHFYGQVARWPHSLFWRRRSLKALRERMR